MTKGPEAPVKDDIKEYLTGIGAWWYMIVPNGYSRKGVPDFLACVPTTITQEMVGRRVGLFAGIEAKADFADGGKVPDKWQDRELEGIAAARGISLVARGATAVETVRQALDFQ